MKKLFLLFLILFSVKIQAFMITGPYATSANISANLPDEVVLDNEENTFTPTQNFGIINANSIGLSSSALTPQAPIHASGSDAVQAILQRSSGSSVSIKMLNEDDDLWVGLGTDESFHIATSADLPATSLFSVSQTSNVKTCELQLQNAEPTLLHGQELTIHDSDSNGDVGIEFNLGAGSSYWLIRQLGTATGTLDSRLSFNFGGTEGFYITKTHETYTRNLRPMVDDTYYLGKNDDDTPQAWKGLILKDQTTGTYYRLQIDSGVVNLVDLTD